MTTITASKHIKRTARIKSVRLGDLKVSPAAQREFNVNHGRKIADNFDLDLAGTFTLSLREGVYWIIDGQHRFFGMKEHVKAQFGEEWSDWTIEAWTHEGLTESQEAELFLTFNSAKPVTGIDKFRVSVTAEREAETDVNRIVLANGLRIAHAGKKGTISAVGSLLAIYSRGGGEHLREVIVTLRNAWDGYDIDSGLLYAVSDVLTRYAGHVSAERLSERLGALKNGAAGVYQAASRAKNQYGGSARESNAVALVNVYNSGLGPASKARIDPWFKSESAAA